MISEPPAQVRHEDEVLFEWLFEQHYRALFGYLLGRCGDRDTASDLLQETFLRVWLHIDVVRQMPKPKTRFWTVSIAKSVLIDSVRRQAVRSHMYCPEPGREPIDERPTPDRVLEGKDTLINVDAGIRSLPVDLRTVLVLSVMEGLSSVEIADMLGIPAGTVRFQLSEARKRLAIKVGLS